MKQTRSNSAPKSTKGNEVPVGKGSERPSRKKKPPFSPKTIEHFKKKLIAYRERITGDCTTLRHEHLQSSLRDAAGDLSAYSMHMADVGTDTFERDLALTMVSSEQDLVYQIDQALSRIEEGEYGVCEGCGRSIKAARLRAVPWAEFCIRCKVREEQKGRGG